MVDVVLVAKVANLERQLLKAIAKRTKRIQPAQLQWLCDPRLASCTHAAEGNAGAILKRATAKEKHAARAETLGCKARDTVNTTEGPEMMRSRSRSPAMLRFNARACWSLRCAAWYVYTRPAATHI